MIDLTEVIAGLKDSITLNEKYSINLEKFNNNEILELSLVEVEGIIEKEEYGNLRLKITVNSKMKIKDSVSLDDVWYPFSFKLDENIDELIKNNENTLDIIELLWQNIVLEVPLRYTTVEDYSKYQGDGWKLVSEEELSYNPFSALLDEKDKE